MSETLDNACIFNDHTVAPPIIHALLNFQCKRMEIFCSAFSFFQNAIASDNTDPRHDHYCTHSAWFSTWMLSQPHNLYKGSMPRMCKALLKEIAVPWQRIRRVVSSSLPITYMKLTLAHTCPLFDKKKACLCFTDSFDSSPCNSCKIR